MQHSIVCLSEVNRTFDLRMDAEYWRPCFIKNSLLVSENKKIKDFIIRDISNIKSNPIERDFEYLEISKIPLNSFGYETVRIQEGEEPDRAHYLLKKNDVAVSTVRPNRNAVAFIDREGVIGSSGLAILRARGIEPEYLFAFCKTNYFIQYLLRANKATMYPAISNKDISDMPLFVPSKNFREQIKQRIQTAISYVKKSKTMFAEAQSVLLSELGLSDWRPKHQLAFIKQYSDIKREGRMDAEYFQPKYEEIVKAIKNYKGGWDSLENLTIYIKSGVQPPYTKGGEIRFFSQKWIKDTNIDYSFLERNNELMISKKFFKENQNKASLVITGDILYYSVGANLGFCHSYLEKEPIAVGSFINIIRANKTKINTEVLGFIINSIIGRIQGDKEKSGLAQPYIYAKNLKKFKIPIIESQIQKQISKRIIEIHKMNKKSKRLLKDSKKAVEIAIEKNEKSALDWLENKFSASSH